MTFVMEPTVYANTNRSTYIPYDYSWYAAPDFKYVALDLLHQQIFLAWTALDRIDVLSTADYHTIQSIAVPSPSSLDISPDGTTLAVGTSSAHIFFFDTGTFAKTNDVVFPDSALGITAFVYAGNGNAFVRAAEGLSTGGGITAYWNHSTNSFSNASNAEGATGPYQTTGPLARSGDYSRIMLGDASSGGNVQIVDGNSGQVLQQLAYGGYIVGLAANNDASRYAVCAEPAGFGTFLIILDSNYNEIYQDESGCIGIAFSTDGNTLYRDVGGNTQAIDMATFSANNRAATPRNGRWPMEPVWFMA
jgi:WD40 repeat protein